MIYIYIYIQLPVLVPLFYFIGPVLVPYFYFIGPVLVPLFYFIEPVLVPLFIEKLYWKNLSSIFFFHPQNTNLKILNIIVSKPRYDKQEKLHLNVTFKQNIFPKKTALVELTDIYIDFCFYVFISVWNDLKINIKLKSSLNFNLLKYAFKVCMWVWFRFSLRMIITFKLERWEKKFWVVHIV